MLHEPAGGEQEKDLAVSYKTKLGAIMVIVYALIYAGFVAINLASPATMGKVILLGLNLAVVYGFGLIIVAIILALVYTRMCSKMEKKLNSPGSEKEGK